MGPKGPKKRERGTSEDKKAKTGRYSESKRKNRETTA